MILAIDQGTTGTTCLVFDEQARLRSRAYREFTQHFPRPGWVEHDADEIWEVARAVAHEALGSAGIPPGQVSAVGITNQRETVVAWDERTGAPLHRAIVWQDRRTAERCDELRAQGFEQLVRERTGLVVDPYFSGTKIEWLLRSFRDCASAPPREACASGRSTRGCPSSSQAARSRIGRTPRARMLFDIHTLSWDEELCDALGVVPAALPEPVPSAHVIADTDPDAFIGVRAPLAGMAGDQQAALFGQAALDPGLGKNTYGTGSFVLQNAGPNPPPVRPGLLTTVAWGIEDRRRLRPGGKRVRDGRGGAVAP